MIEVTENLFVGAQSDEQQVRGETGWFFIHACKEPYHRDALGYTGRAISNQHPEYLIARRPGRLILNLVDLPDVRYISPLIVDAALDAARDNIGTTKVLIHCNLGQSRSPTIALLYLAKYSDKFRGLGFEESAAAFRKIYPSFAPAQGMADYARLNWAKYSR